MNLSRRQSLILFNALMLGDGSQRGDNYAYYSKSKQLADDVQELAMRCGYAASVVSHAVGRDLYRVNIRPAKDAHLVTPESIRYGGNVYCVNVRNHVICVRRNGRAAFCGQCYDEGKRIAETLSFDYHRQNKVDIRVARIFNSLTGDQKVIYYQGDTLYYESFAACYDRIAGDISQVSVPCFDKNSQYVIKPISAIWKHKVQKKGYTITTTWGKKVKITEDHSLFTRDENGSPKAVFGKDLKIGDLVASPHYLPFIDKPLASFFITDKISPETVSIVPQDVVPYLEQYRDEIRNYLTKTQQPYSIIKEYEATNSIPLKLWQYLGLPLTDKEKIKTLSSGQIINNFIDNINELLWFLGYYLAVGDGKSEDRTPKAVASQLVLSTKYQEKLLQITQDLFGFNAKIDTSGKQ
ncbi:MAG: NAD-dependent dehydratase, partial [Prochloron sp. SP5CPC1]|nr:NAD-dependent dehydratase [Candidatus Paraprochloron terpiosi SP5CPC1]